MDIRVSYYSAPGARDNNEDHVLVTACADQSLLALVADGLGGHQQGELASATANETIARILSPLAPSEGQLEAAICQANQAVQALNRPGCQCKTTVAALWLGDQGCCGANVGDSRIYQFREGRIVYQSTDHSVAQMAVLLGELTPDQIRTSRERNKLIRALGNPEAPIVDHQPLEVRPGDRFLLCSDGFWEPVLENQMLAALAAAPTPRAWLERLTGHIEALQDPKQDNHSAIALMVDACE